MTILIRRPAIMIAVGVWLTAGVACTNSPASPSATVAASESTMPAAHVATSTANTSSLPEFIASGPIIVENEVDVTAQRDGVVEKITCEPGTPVRKGQILGALDDRQITADLEAARAKTRSTENDLKNCEAEAKVLDSDYARAEKMWDAQIIQVSPVVDPSSDTIEILAELSGDTGGLRPGMRADVHVPDVK